MMQTCVDEMYWIVSYRGMNYVLGQSTVDGVTYTYMYTYLDCTL